MEVSLMAKTKTFQEQRRAILEGAASIFDIAPHMTPRNFDAGNDMRNLARDWHNIGRDLAHAMKCEEA